MAKGKYEHVIKDLPKDFGQEPKYQEKINAVKTAMLAEGIATRSATQLAQLVERIDEEKEVVEADLSEVNLRLTAAHQMLVEQYDLEDIKSLALAEAGRSVSVELLPMPKINDREKFRLWCIKNGLERELSLHPSTAVAMIRERLLNGEEQPDGVEVTARPSVKVRNL